MRVWLSLVAMLVLAGCAGSAAREPASAPSRTVAEDVQSCDPSRERRLGDRRHAYAVVVERAPTAAYDRPGGKRLRTFWLRNVNGVRSVFGVLAVRRNARCDSAWYRVQLPIRPNGATGYVRASDVTAYRLATRIEVDLSERRVVLLRQGRPVLKTTAAIGAAETPTPIGRYYVNQRLLTTDPSGPYGPGGIGISAFSPVLTGWTQGGPIAIHGTNDPGSIGEAASSGCLRVANDVLRRLFAVTPAGTPVIIRG